MGLTLTVRGSTCGWQQTGRQPIPAPLVELLRALTRLRAEAGVIAQEAYLAIQHHSYAPYWHFRAKLEEHAALVTILRGRVSRMKDAQEAVKRIDDEEREILVLSIRSCLKFCFALSANPLLPIGARETFIHEVDALQQARETLKASASNAIPPDVLDELDTTLMILEEIIEKAPSLADFARTRRRTVEATESEGAETSLAAV